MAAQPLLVEVHDAAIRVHEGSTPLACEVGYATVEGNRVQQTGDAARADAKRHPRRTVNDAWHRLNTEPLETVSLTRADLAAAQIQSLLPPSRFAGRQVVLLLPGALPRDQLSLLLGVFQACDLTVIGLIDIATIGSQHFYRDQTLLHIDMGLHATTVSRIRQDEGGSSLDDVRVVDGSGLHAMSDAWMKFLAMEFVRQCRFDPLHSAESEQRMFDALPEWLLIMEQQESAELTLSAAGHSHAISVTRVDIINVVAEHYQRIADVARALAGGGGAIALQLRFAAASLPGFAQMLSARTGGGFFTINDADPIQHAASVLPTLALSPTKILTQTPVAGERTAAVTTDSTDEDMPSHALLDAHAFGLAGDPLTIGSGSEQTRTRYLKLDGSPAGVSGVHCELRIEGGQCVVTDHSRYGTFLNGNRISGSATLRNGDVLRVGTPGREIQMIRLETL